MTDYEKKDLELKQKILGELEKLNKTIATPGTPGVLVKTLQGIEWSLNQWRLDSGKK